MDCDVGPVSVACNRQDARQLKCIVTARSSCIWSRHACTQSSLRDEGLWDLILAVKVLPFPPYGKPRGRDWGGKPVGSGAGRSRWARRLPRRLRFCPKGSGTGTGMGGGGVGGLKSVFSPYFLLMALRWTLGCVSPFLYIYLFVRVYTRQGAHMGGKGQLAEVGSLLLPRGSQGLNSGQSGLLRKDTSHSPG